MQTLQLPVILDRLSPQARSWIIAKSAQKDIGAEQLARELIEKAAEKDGFKAPPEKLAA